MARVTEVMRRLNITVDNEGVWHPPGARGMVCQVMIRGVCDDLWKKEFPPQGVPSSRKTPLVVAGSDFKGMWFCGPLVFLDDAIFRGANLEGAELVGVRLHDADFSEARLVNCSGTIFGDGARFCRADLANADLSFLGCSRAHDFTGAMLTGATIILRGPSKATEPPANFTDADLTGAKLEIECSRAPVFTRACLKNCQIILPVSMTELETVLTEQQRAEATLVRKPTPPPEPVPPPSKCFIATAACGTDQAEDVVRLRIFRERILRRTNTGKRFVNWYETASPPIARIIERWRCLRYLTRKLIVAPARLLADRLLADQTRGKSRHD